jgi:hypothetical protein
VTFPRRPTDSKYFVDFVTEKMERDGHEVDGRTGKLTRGRFRGGSRRGFARHAVYELVVRNFRLFLRDFAQLFDDLETKFLERQRKIGK